MHWKYLNYTSHTWGNASSVLFFVYLFCLVFAFNMCCALKETNIPYLGDGVTSNLFKTFIHSANFAFLIFIVRQLGGVYMKQILTSHDGYCAKLLSEVTGDCGPAYFPETESREIHSRPMVSSKRGELFPFLHNLPNKSSQYLLQITQEYYFHLF